MSLRWRAHDDGSGPAPDGRRTHPGWSIYCECGEPRAALLPVGTPPGGADFATWWRAVLVCPACDAVERCKVSACDAEHGLWPDAIARLRDVWPRG